MRTTAAKDTQAKFKAEKASRSAALLAAVERHEARKTLVAWIPEDGSSYVPGRGYRVAIVEAGAGGYWLTGTWPYTGAPGEKAPWFWGHDLKAAQDVCREHNERIHVTPDEATLIVGRSMARG